LAEPTNLLLKIHSGVILIECEGERLIEKVFSKVRTGDGIFNPGQNVGLENIYVIFLQNAKIFQVIRSGKQQHDGIDCETVLE
jgi:hypothetical protein